MRSDALQEEAAAASDLTRQLVRTEERLELGEELDERVQIRRRHGRPKLVLIRHGGADDVVFRPRHAQSLALSDLVQQPIQVALASEHAVVVAQNGLIETVAAGGEERANIRLVLPS